MNADPMPYIIFAAIVGACIGFFACALFASGTIRRIKREAFRQGKTIGTREAANIILR